MLDPLPSSVILTLDDVKRIRDERNALAAKVLDLNAQLAVLDSKLSAVRLFIDHDTAHHLLDDVGQNGGVQESSEKHKRAKWGAAIIPMLAQVGHGLTSKQIKSRLSDELQSDAGVHGHALYGGLAKLVAKGSLVKDGDYYCLPGQGRPEQAEVGGREVYESAIRAALVVVPEGLSSGDIISELRKGPVGPRIGRSTGYFYKVLAEMLLNGELTKEGKKYRVSKEASQ